MRDDEAPGPLTPASAAQPPARLGREDPRNFRSGMLASDDGFDRAPGQIGGPPPGELGRPHDPPPPQV
jgi:hypothetical protein